MRDPSKTAALDHGRLVTPDLATRGVATVAETAEILKCSTKTVRRYIADGRLTAYRVGPKMLRVELPDVDGLLRAIPTRRAS